MSPSWAILMLDGCPWPDYALAVAIVPPLAILALSVCHLSLLITERQGSEHPHSISPPPYRSGPHQGRLSKPSLVVGNGSDPVPAAILRAIPILLTGFSSRRG